ncbi:hypothetical protein PAPYR_13086 [Paratrimastix pyriformis]|uniref:SH2 domain-containing protein n=1 Tax=Paratrimastix pyriformis TaxID=342808 RepID=A0ABQ8U0U7_9EUKA|nr:hypothetical protein PAPYR_13086 [Paratrimastix pyriformis]
MISEPSLQDKRQQGKHSDRKQKEASPIHLNQSSMPPSPACAVIHIPGMVLHPTIEVFQSCPPCPPPVSVPTQPMAPSDALEVVPDAGFSFLSRCRPALPLRLSPTGVFLLEVVPDGGFSSLRLSLRRVSSSLRLSPSGLVPLGEVTTSPTEIIDLLFQHPQEPLRVLRGPGLTVDPLTGPSVTTSPTEIDLRNVN